MQPSFACMQASHGAALQVYMYSYVGVGIWMGRGSGSGGERGVRAEVWSQDLP